MKIIIKNNEHSFNGIELPLSIQYSILMASNKSLEEDLDNIVSNMKNVENGQHLWAITWRSLRLDDLEGVGLYYFIKEVIDYLSLNQNIYSITLEGEFENYFKNYLTANYPNIKVKKKNTIKYIKSRMSYHLGPLKYILKAILKRESKDEIDAQIWMSSSLNISKHRYKHLMARIIKTKAFYVGRMDIAIDTRDKGKSINFINYLTFLDVFESFRDAIHLSRVKKKIKPIKLIDYTIRDNKIHHSMATILKEKSVANAIKINKPERILFTTANTYSPARIVARQAYLNSIPFIVVACRPMFTKARLEERLIYADRLKINNAHVADAYTVWDEYSKQTLIGQGVCEKSIYVTSPNASKFQKDQPTIKFENALLVLFTHEESLNQKFINELVQLKNNRDVIIRQHPLKQLTVSQYEELDNSFNIIYDISSMDYGNFEFVNIMAITVNSTAIIEAVSHGCGAIWLPYLNSRSLLFFEIMNQIGILIENICDLENLLSMKDSELKKIITDCQEKYLMKFKAEDETLEFLENIKLI